MAEHNKLQRVMIMAGGTGGHVFPGLAIANALQAKGIEVSWLGTPRGLEAQLIPAAGMAFIPLKLTGFRGKNFLTRLTAPFYITVALGKALATIYNMKPDIVIGMGGFVAGPGGLAAWLLRKPLVIHEQNAIAGITNRLLASIATRVLEAFPNTFAVRYKAICTGNPIRAEISKLPAPAERYQNRSGPLRLLVLGGSLGAAVINETIPLLLQQVNDPKRLEVKHQTGQAHFATTQAKYKALNVEAEVSPFISDMAAAYNWADIVLCRAGALTVTELAAAGLPAILVPFPHAVDDHQTVNGNFLVAAGAAVMIPQPELSVMRLMQVLEPVWKDRNRLLVMAEAARTLFKATATASIVAICEQIFESGK